MLLTKETFNNIEVGDIVVFIFNNTLDMKTLVVSTRYCDAGFVFGCKNLAHMFLGINARVYEYDIDAIYASFKMILIKGYE